MEIESRLAALETREKTSEHRLADLENEMRDLRALTQAVTRTNSNVEHLQREVGEMRRDLRDLSSKPGKRWDGVVTTLITTVVGALFGALIAALLGGVSV